VPTGCCSAAAWLNAAAQCRRAAAVLLHGLTLRLDRLDRSVGGMDALETGRAGAMGVRSPSGGVCVGACALAGSILSGCPQPNRSPSLWPCL
jgi:hypothetical protein